MVAAAAVVEPTILFVHLRQARPGSRRRQRAFYFGGAMVIAAAWSSTIGVGISLGTHVGLASLLGICTPLCLTAVVGPHMRTPAGARCVLAAAVVAVGTSSYAPPGLSLLLAMAAGAVAGGGRAAVKSDGRGTS
jgi:predicted branched-subunit amino acid permease